MCQFVLGKPRLINWLWTLEATPAFLVIKCSARLEFFTRLHLGETLQKYFPNFLYSGNIFRLFSGNDLPFS